MQRARAAPRRPARATSPAAIPATVGSTGSAKALFVPAGIGRSGVSPAPAATSRFVPSPPSVTMTPTPAAVIARAARVVSAGESSARSIAGSTAMPGDSAAAPVTMP